MTNAPHRPEPTNDEEAHDLEDFLKRGAEVSVETVRELPPVAAVIDVRQPVTVPIVDSDGIVGELDDELDVQLTLEFEHLPVQPNYPIAVLVNSPNPVDGPELSKAPGFVGTISFFGSEHAGHSTTVFVLSGGDAVRRVPNDTELQVSFVAMPEPDRDIEVKEIPVNVLVAVTRSQISIPE